MSDHFKIISSGRELRYPMLRLLTLMAYCILFGVAIGGEIMRHILTVQ